MNIIQKNISEIKPYEKNPRKNDEAVEYVMKSIKEFGFKIPVIIDKNNVIVAGHTRYKACEKLGIRQIPCIIVDDLTDEQIKAFRLVDNKASEKSEWDFELLNEELSNFLNVNMEDFEFLNIDYSYIDDLVNDDFTNLDINSSVFNVSFTFPIEKKNDIQEYIKKNGKEHLVSIILEEINKCQSVEVK